MNQEEDFPGPVVRERPVCRYAPSPTGDLHPGNLRTALIAREDCRRVGGIFILRIEDIDTPRTVAGAEGRMIEDLRWLGLDWDEGPDIGGPAGPYRQSERSGIYEQVLRGLEARGLTYLCTCSRRELREASAPHAGEETAEAVYPGFCRAKNREEQRADPRGAATRMLVEGMAEIMFEDLHAGVRRHDLARECGDFVIRRRDGLWAYQLACAADDALMGVTRVIRGEDLLSSTPRQIAVIRAMGLREPVYGHIPLAADAAGNRMSKRDGSESVRTLRERGVPADEAREMIMNLPLVPGSQSTR